MNLEELIEKVDQYIVLLRKTDPYLHEATGKEIVQAVTNENLYKFCGEHVIKVLKIENGVVFYKYVESLWKSLIESRRIFECNLEYFKNQAEKL